MEREKSLKPYLMAYLKIHSRYKYSFVTQGEARFLKQVTKSNNTIKGKAGKLDFIKI